jgi:hypothetical protein
MCGRVIQSSGPLRYAIVDGMNVRDSRMHNYPPRWNGAPSQDLLVIRRNHKTGEVSLDPLRWGLIPYWCSDPKGGRKPINAKCESVRDLPTFRDAYRRRRCIVPVDGFFEWKAIKGQKAKQPYAIAMKDGAPFRLSDKASPPLWGNGSRNRTVAFAIGLKYRRAATRGRAMSDSTATSSTTSKPQSQSSSRAIGERFFSSAQLTRFFRLILVLTALLCTFIICISFVYLGSGLTA